MHRIDGDGAVDGRFVTGDPQTGQKATQVTAAWLNSVQEEILGVITAAGIVPAKDNDSQLLAAISSLASSAGVSESIIRFSIPGAVLAGSNRVVCALSGITGVITRVGGRISGSGGAKVSLKKDGASVVQWVVYTTNGSENLRSGTQLANTGVAELSLLSLYVNDISGAPEDLTVFIHLTPNVAG